MQQSLTGQLTFNQFVFVQHKKVLVSAMLVMIALFLVYKVVYPLPDMYVDSYHYIGIAENKNFMSVWPVGYSWFLRGVHFLSPSPYLLVIVQYLLLQLGSFWLAFTLCFFFGPPKWVVSSLVAFFAVNPLYFYLANLVSSDVFFTALSLFWLTILVRMVFDAKLWHALLQGPLLAYLFLVRYQALYYPLIMIFALWLAEFNVLWKVISALLAFLLLGWIINRTLATNKKWFGISQFSPQGGWILANNAMYMYPHIQINANTFSGHEQIQLNNYVDSFFKARGLLKRNYTPFDGPRFMLANEVMWNHLSVVLHSNPSQPVFWNYNRMGPQWQRYGSTLIWDHPLAYVRYFLVPNIGVYLLPVVEQFDQYSMGAKSMPRHVAKWFHLSDNRYRCKWREGAGYLAGMFRPLFLLLNLYLIVVGIAILRKKKYLLVPPVHRRVLLLLTVFFIGNACMLVVSSSVMLRYQSYAIVLGTILLFLLLPLFFIKMNKG